MKKDHKAKNVLKKDNFIEKTMDNGVVLNLDKDVCRENPDLDPIGKLLMSNFGLTQEFVFNFIHLVLHNYCILCFSVIICFD
jgi:hypothetical protein